MEEFPKVEEGSGGELLADIASGGHDDTTIYPVGPAHLVSLKY